MSRHVLLCTLLLAASMLTGCKEPEPAVTAPRPTMVVQPQPADLEVQSYPGEIRARFEPELAFRIGGKVIRRMVDTGQRVEKDQPLAELDPQDVRLQLEASRAQLAAAQANLQLAKAERERYTRLLERQLISASQYDAVDNNYRAAAAQLKRAHAEFDVADNQTRYSTLRAPQAGVITNRAVEIGQVVAAGQTVLVLAADGEREVLISLPETVISQIKVGQQVHIQLWSRPEDQLSGVIRELAPAADQQSRTFAARVSLTGETGEVELGQSARVLINNPQEVPLAVPLSAVSAEGGQSFVWVVDPQTLKVKQRPVRIGSYRQNQVSIIEGLHSNDWVVSAGVHMLLEDQLVQPIDRQNRSLTLSKE